MMTGGFLDVLLGAVIIHHWCLLQHPQCLPKLKKVEKSKKRSYNNKSMKPKKQVKKKAVRAKRRKYDSAWKEVIEKLFEQFLEFFFPKLHTAIDFNKKIEFLDTGMRPINPFSDMGDRAADI